MINNLVSIIMPAYNAGRTISESIDSVLSQSYQDWELLVVDDCSKDNTLDVIQKYADGDNRITIIKNEKNLGVAASRNKAIAMARGEWVAFLDADDLWCGDKLEKQILFANQHSDAVLIYTAAHYMNADGIMYKYVMPVELKFGFKQLLHRNILICSSVLLRKDIAQQVPMKDGCLHEDYLEWLEITKPGYFAYGINEPLVIYRLQEESRSSNRLKAAYMSYNTYRAIGFNVLYSAYLVVRYTFYSVGKRRKIKNV